MFIAKVKLRQNNKKFCFVAELRGKVLPKVLHMGVKQVLKGWETLFWKSHCWSNLVVDQLKLKLDLVNHSILWEKCVFVATFGVNNNIIYKFQYGFLFLEGLLDTWITPNAVSSQSWIPKLRRQLWLVDVVKEIFIYDIRSARRFILDQSEALFFVFNCMRIWTVNYLIYMTLDIDNKRTEGAQCLPWKPLLKD